MPQGFSLASYLNAAMEFLFTAVLTARETLVEHSVELFVKHMLMLRETFCGTFLFPSWPEFQF